MVCFDDTIGADDPTQGDAAADKSANSTSGGDAGEAAVDRIQLVILHHMAMLGMAIVQKIGEKALGDACPRLPAELVPLVAGPAPSWAPAEAAGTAEVAARAAEVCVDGVSPDAAYARTGRVVRDIIGLHIKYRIDMQRLQQGEASHERRIAGTARGFEAPLKRRLRELVTEQIKTVAMPQDAERMLGRLGELLAQPDIADNLERRPIAHVVEYICNELGFEADFGRYPDADLGFDWDPSEADRDYCERNGLVYEAPEADPAASAGRPPTRLGRPALRVVGGMRTSKLPPLPGGFVGPGRTIVPPPAGYQIGPDPPESWEEKAPDGL